MTDLFWFSDEQWALIEPMLPKNTRGLKRVDDHRVLGIVTSTGATLAYLREIVEASDKARGL